MLHRPTWFGPVMSLYPGYVVDARVQFNVKIVWGNPPELEAKFWDSWAYKGSCLLPSICPETL
jgi:hypothetical protein